MQNDDQNYIAVANLSSVSIAAPHRSCLMQAAQRHGSVVAPAMSKKCSPVALRAALLRQRSQFTSAGIERPTPYQRPIRPRRFAFGSSSGIIASQVSLLPSSFKTETSSKFAKALPPNHSLNRTFCGVSQLGFISFSPNCLTPQNAG